MGLSEQSKYAIGSMRGWGSPKEESSASAAKEISPGASSQHVEEGAETTEPATKPGIFKRLWLHYKRHWILYTVAVVIFLAIFLPVLYVLLAWW